MKSLPFLIKPYGLLPGATVDVPQGEVLLVAFKGDEAVAWVKHHPTEENAMVLLTLPTSTDEGQAFELETDERFFQPEHVGSFVKIIPHKIKTAGMIKPPVHLSAWHVFVWKRKPSFMEQTFN